MVESVHLLLASLTVVGQVLLVLGLGWLVMAKKQVKLKNFNHYILLAVYAVSLISTLGSLFYSDVAGYTPCKLCWYQRIMMYPQALMYLVALAQKDMRIGIYGVVLSVVGWLLAGYHYLLQVGIVPTTNCSTVGFSVSCSERFSTTWGYITIPMMAWTAFSLILVGWAVYYRQLRLEKK